MISQLSGILIEKNPPLAIIDVNGVGYEIIASMHTLYELKQEQILLYTHLVVREDQHTLYGFHNKRERETFKQLIKINGVGPKFAIGILSGMTPNDLAYCIEQEDQASLVKIPGIGKKTAERLIIELRDKLDVSQNISLNSNKKDAINALIALGYRENEINKALKHCVENLTCEELIRQSLNILSGK